MDEDQEVPVRIRRHGTTTEYRKYGCRCQKCKEANRLSVQEWRVLTGRTKNPGSRKPAEHGTRSKYNHGCHCEACTKANRDYQRALYPLYRDGVSLTEDRKTAPKTRRSVSHGTVRKYHLGCTCVECKQAHEKHLQQMRDWRGRKRQAQGTDQD